jgi:hypothetical protein
MFSVRRVLLTFALGTALGAGPAIAAPAMAHPWDDDHDNDWGRQVHLTASLSGRGVVGEARDRNGAGEVDLKIRPSTGEVCYDFWVRRVEDPMRIFVYVGGRNDPNDRDDDVEVGLANYGSHAEGCRKISPRVARAIANWPSRYNVQVDGDNGAIRGQLRYDRWR